MYKESVNEEDVHVTEAQIGSAFNRLKRSITDIPGQVSKPVTGSVKEHPFAALLAAAAAGFIAHEVVKRSQPRVVVKEIPGVKGKPGVVKSVAGDVFSQLVSQLVPVATPYVAMIIEKELTKLMSKR